MYIYDDKIGKVELVSHMGDDKSIVNAARVSYGKQVEFLSDKDIKLIKYLYNNKHMSCFEHCSMTFRFKVPLFVRSQHHRHRTWSFNEISRRYTEENLEFYFPENKWRTQSKSSKQASNDSLYIENYASINDCFKESQNIAVSSYNSMISQGVAREMARMILPQNLYTEYYGTVNLRNALAFLDLRLHPHAQLEIRKVAEAMKQIMFDLYPKTMECVYETSRHN